MWNIWHKLNFVTGMCQLWQTLVKQKVAENIALKVVNQVIDTSVDNSVNVDGYCDNMNVPKQCWVATLSLLDPHNK